MFEVMRVENNPNDEYVSKIIKAIYLKLEKA